MKTWLCPILSMSVPDNNLTRNRNAETSAGVHESPQRIVIRYSSRSKRIIDMSASALDLSN